MFIVGYSQLNSLIKLFQDGWRKYAENFGKNRTQNQ